MQKKSLVMCSLALALAGPAHAPPVVVLHGARYQPRFRRLVGPLLRTPEQGADTIVWLLATGALPAWMRAGLALVPAV